VLGGVGVKCHAVIALMVMASSQNHNSATLPFTVYMLDGLLCQTVMGLMLLHNYGWVLLGHL
jgi:hypothetical protein